MSLTHYFRGDDGVVVEITDNVRLYTFETTMQAEEGSVGTSEVPVDDPSSELTIGGHRLFYSLEDAATGSNTVTYVGYTADRNVTRGPYKTDVGREWRVNLVDVNSVLSRRILTGSTANRPAETDVARIQWLAGTEEADIIDDFSMVDTTGAVMMDAVDYRGQRPDDVLNDCSQQSGKNYFLTNVGTFAGNFWLFYRQASDETYSSPLRLSNSLADVDDTWTFAISEDTKLRRDPSRVYSGIHLPYDGGTVYVTSAATANTFALKGRDASMPAENVKSLARATARANRYLADLDTEEDRITTSFRVPAAKVNFLREGMRVQFRAVHLPGYDSFTWLRCLTRTVKQDSEESYWVTVELSASDPAPVVPPASAAYGILYQPDNEAAGTSFYPDVLYAGSGDSPPSGYPAVPKQGLLSYALDSPQRNASYPYIGFTSTGTGSLDVEFVVTAIHALTGDVTTTFAIYKNGVSIASDVQSSSGGARGINYSSTVAVTTSVVPGDVITSKVTTTASAILVPSGTGAQSNHLEVTGTLA